MGGGDGSRMSRQPDPTEIVDYDTITDLITEYGVTMYAAGGAISHDTHHARKQAAGMLLAAITINLNRLYRSLGHDV